MDRRTIHRIAILILATAGLSTAVVIVLIVTLGGSVLEGESHYDYGVVLIDAPSSTFEHTFHLINESDETIVIESARPSCSCTTAELSTKILEPGDVVDVATRMTLRASAHREISVTLALDNDQIHRLWVEAGGRLRQQLRSTATFLRVAPGSSAMMVVWVEVWEDIEDAPEPTLVTPEGVTAKFTRWDLHRKGNERQGLPASWSGRIVVEQQADALPEGAVMTVQHASNEPVIVHLFPTLPPVAPGGSSAEPPPNDR